LRRSSDNPTGGSPQERAERYHEGPAIDVGARRSSEIFAGRMFAVQTPAYVEAAKRAGDTVHATVALQSVYLVLIDPDRSADSSWSQPFGTS
jgi:hypothetical protein